MENSQYFGCEVDFCPVCGMILSLPNKSTFVECKNNSCNYKIEIESWWLKIFFKILVNIILHKTHFNSILTYYNVIFVYLIMCLINHLSGFCIRPHPSTLILISTDDIQIYLNLTLPTHPLTVTIESLTVFQIYSNGLLVIL